MTDGSGRWFKPSAAASYEEDTRWDGHNHISVATGSQWEHERLWRTASGAWVRERWSQWEGTLAIVQQIEAETAYVWLSANGHELPPEAAAFAAELEV